MAMNDPLRMGQMPGTQPMQKVPATGRQHLQGAVRSMVQQGKLPNGVPLPPMPKGPARPANQTLAMQAKMAPPPPPITPKTGDISFVSGGKSFPGTVYSDGRAAFRAAVANQHVFFRDNKGQFIVAHPKDLGKALGISEMGVRQLAHLGRLEAVVGKYCQYSKAIDGFAEGAKKLVHKGSKHRLKMRPQELMKAVAQATIAMAQYGRTQVEVKAKTGLKTNIYKVMLTQGGGIEVVRKVRTLASGAFGTVGEGRVMWSGARVAMKNLQESRTSPAERQRMLQALQAEAKVGFEIQNRLRRAGLSSRGIVGPPFKAQDLTNPKGFPVIFSRLAEGDGSVVTKEKRFQETGARLNVMHQMFAGQAKLDRIGVANLDIKVENMLVEGHNVRIADFGDVKTKEEFDAGDKSFTCSRFALPEHDETVCTQSYGARSKTAVFLLGVTFYQMLFGVDATPFEVKGGRPKAKEGESLLTKQAEKKLRKAKIPEPVIDLLKQAMHNDPDKRPSALEIQQTLEKHCEGKPLGEYWKRHQ